MSEKTKIAVTPPTVDSPHIRLWMKTRAQEAGWTALEWRETEPPSLWGRQGEEG